MSRPDLCEKLHDDVEHLSLTTVPRDWMHYRMVTDGQMCLLVRLPDWRARVRTKHCYRLIKTGDLSNCSGGAQCKMVDTSEPFTCLWSLSRQPKGEHHSGQVSEQRDTALSFDQSEQVIRHLKQEIEHLRHLTFVPRIRTLTASKQAMLLLENHIGHKLTESRTPWLKFWKKPWPRHASVFLSAIPGSFLNLPKNRQISERPHH